MRVEQGEIVEVNFLLPDGKTKPHPAIVLSNNDINQFEEAFIGVMISSSAPDDTYSYRLENNMLTKSPKRQCQVRCQLISLIPENQVISIHECIKKQYFKELLLKINDCVFSIDE
jgi:mRNA-degrading endonuclease toxin of MazEF toxin-antitoxin module